MKDIIYEYHADLCKVFSHPKRLELINTLRDREMSAGELGSLLNLSPANLSQHLSMMKERKLLLSRKEGNMIYYRLAHPELLQAFDILRGILFSQIEGDARLIKNLRQ